MFNILILCTGNSARSIIGEALLNAHAGDGLRGYSAGSTPKGAPHPGAIAVLTANGHDVSKAFSKSWGVFAEPGAPAMGAVITVCDNAAGEVCPVWPGRPATAHWGLPDPAAVDDPAAQAAAFEATYAALKARIQAAAALPLAEMTPEARAEALQAIHDRLA